MKIIFTISLMMVVASLSHAQPPEEPQEVRGTLVIEEDDRLKKEEVFVLAVTDKSVAYKFNIEDDQPEVVSRKNVDSIFLYDPRDYMEAMDLYQGRKYAEAKAAFAAVKKRYAGKYRGISNNFEAMAAFYELECLRKLNDLEGLRLALIDYEKHGLSYKVALQQLELYVLWDLIRADLNQEALKVVESYKGKRLPGHQRAQIAYCHGRALEGLKKPKSDILNAYQTALTADAGASEVIARDALMRSLAILEQDQEMHDAIKMFEESNAKEVISGFSSAMEGAGLCQMYQTELGGSEPLPSKYSFFLKYTPEIVKERMDASKKGGESEDTE